MLFDGLSIYVRHTLNSVPWHIHFNLKHVIFIHYKILFAGILYTGIIRRYGPGVCVICGSVIAFLGLFVSSFAINLAMVIVFTGVVGGEYNVRSSIDSYTI